MNNVIFREYDIRGIVGVDLMIEETYNLARAIAAYVAQHTAQQHKTLIVGMDVRTHSPALHTELCRGLQESGYTIIDIGLCSSPMLYFATHTLSCDGGIMITASHNPGDYNGFKIVAGTHLVWGSAIRTIKELYATCTAISVGPHGFRILHNILPAYIQWLLEQFPTLHDMQLPVAFDCANGATSIVMPKLVSAFRWSHATVLYAEPDGTFPNHPADPIDMHNMQDLWQLMKQKNITIGFGFDGDGDRMDALDETGYLMPGDQLVALFARSIAAHHPHCTAVCDITVSAAVLDAIHNAGARTIIVPCGAGIIKEQMHVHNALVGGELSCHFFFADRTFCFDDGIYAALRLLEILVQSQQSLYALRAQLPTMVSSPQYRITCDEHVKKELVTLVGDAVRQKPDTEILTIDGARITRDYGWSLIRASNTQPMIVCRFEATHADALHTLKKEFADLLSPHLGDTIYSIFGI